MVTEFEWWQIGIGIATLIVAILTLTLEVNLHRIQVIVILREIGKGIKVINRSNHDTFIFEGRIKNKGLGKIQYQEVDLLLNGKKIPIKPEISPVIWNNIIPEYLETVFIYRFGLITTIIDEMIKDIDTAKIQFIAKLHNGRTIKSKKIKFKIIE